MMKNQLFHDKDNKLCAAKVAYMLTLCVFLIKILLSGVEINGFKSQSADLVGMAAFLAAVGATYAHRSLTKSKQA